MAHLSTKLTKRNRRHARVRSKISGTAKLPRITVFKSNREVYVQVIDDVANKTLVGMGSAKIKAPKKEGNDGNKVKSAFVLGQTLAETMKKQGISEAKFDRGGFKYHGRIKAVADGLREGGIKV